jgi:hypothetical protein
MAQHSSLDAAELIIDATLKTLLGVRGQALILRLAPVCSNAGQLKKPRS